MPSLRVAKNEDHLCTVGSAGLLMISASVSGDIWSMDASHLNVTGGTERDDGKTDFLIWEFDHGLKDGDLLHFSFQEGDSSSREPEMFDHGKQLADVNPSPAWPPSELEIKKWEERPRHNSSLAWRFSTNGNESRVFRPEGGRQQLSFLLLWNNLRPERIRVSLHSTSLREVVARSGGAEYVTEYVPIGSYFELQIGA